MTFLQLKNVSKSYAGAKALSGAKLNIAFGEVHALMGENGAGKSTLIKVLAGVTQPDSMDLLLDECPVNVASAQDAFDLGFRFIHQELNIVPELSVAENIALGHPYPTRFGIAVNWNQLNYQAESALIRLKVDHINPRQKMAQLSTGDQMLVKIASTLVTLKDSPARLYVMDEPTAALTSEESKKLFDVIEELKNSGASILYVSHRINEVMDICDAVTIFRDGQYVRSSPISEISKQQIIKDMTGRDVRDAYPMRATSVGDSSSLMCSGVATKKIRDLNFELKSGEILGVAGLANMGQSEVLLTLLGVDKLSAGAIKLNNNTPNPKNPAAAWHSKIAYVPRERRGEGLMLNRSITDNIALPHLDKLSGFFGILNREKQLHHGKSLGEKVRLKSDSLDQPAYQLSGGNQQKVVFARAIGDTPQLLLLDEPTRGVDVGAKFDIYTLIRELSAGGTAVVMTSSDLPELISMCDRILIMHDGVQQKIISTKGLHSSGLLSMFYQTGEPA